MSYQNNKKSYSWTTIVIVLFIFWPIGLIMLFSKLSNDKTASFGDGAGVIKFIGVVLVLFGGLMFFTLLLGDATMIVGGLFTGALFTVPGFYLIKKSKEVQNSGSKNRKYIELIINNKVNEVHEIARLMRISQDVVIKDVNAMINRGLLGAARLNLNSGVIQFPRPKRKQDNYTTQNRNQRTTQYVEPQFEQFEPKTIRCTSCSANNFIESLPAQCDYCGSSLH